ncbi:hypothetical protein [Halobacillus sp. B29]|uniref:hypothetical protein n=1 Tax=Halobacillus sp. B29 TaxID=3457432 RepID=UPI003FCD848A
MSLTKKISSSQENDKKFKDILLKVTPKKKDFHTMSGNAPFSKVEYELLVPNKLTNQGLSSLVGTAFDYLARFKIGQFIGEPGVTEDLVAYEAIPKLNSVLNVEIDEKPVREWKEKIDSFLQDKSASITSIYTEAVRLARLEHVFRAPIKKEYIQVDDLLYGTPPQDTIQELDGLMSLFEQRFLIPEIITPESEVIFNPHFGAASFLVEGADADIYIDGTLYDFKTTKKEGYARKDVLELVGYYFLNEFAIRTMSDENGFPYKDMDIKRVSLYKARFGEVEYFDVGEKLSTEEKENTIQELAKYFQPYEKNLHFNVMADTNAVKKRLKEMRESQRV